MEKSIIFILLSMLLSCTGNKAYDQQLSKADSIMDIADDSAQITIKMLDALKPEWSKFTKAQRMRYDLLYHKAMNKAYIDFTSDSTMLAVVDYYEHHGTANDKMLAYYILGCVYRDMHETPMALEYYNKATEQADTAAQDCDYATLCRVYSQMGVLFSKQYLPYQELFSFEKATHYAYKAHDTLNAIRYYYNKTGAYTYLDNEDSAIIVNTKAAELFRKHGYDRDADIAFGCNYVYYLKRNNIDKAKKAFEAYNRVNFAGNQNYEDSYAFLLYEKGLFFLQTNQLDSAYCKLNESLKLSKSFSNKAITTKTLAQYYLKRNNPILAAMYAMKSTEYNDSDLVRVRKTQLHQLQAMYDYSRNKRLAMVAEQKSEKRIMVIYVVILCSIILFCLSIFIYKLQMNKKNHRISLIQQLYNDSLLKLQSNQRELQRVKDLNELEVIQQKEEVIMNLKNTIKDIREKFSGSLLTDTDIILQNSAIFRKIQFIILHPKEKLSNEDWIELSDLIEQLIPSFPQMLKNRLTEKEYHICLLIRLHISPSSISNLVGLSNSGVSLSRKRMLEKVCGKDGTAKDFDKFILSLV
jgi:DNA-binding CsgD family transcriptional regulator